MNITITSVESMVLGILIGFCFTSFAFIMNRAFGTRSQKEYEQKKDELTEYTSTALTLDQLLDVVKEDNLTKLGILDRMFERGSKLTSKIIEKEKE